MFLTELDPPEGVIPMTFFILKNRVCDFFFQIPNNHAGSARSSAFESSCSTQTGRFQRSTNQDVFIWRLRVWTQARLRATVAVFPWCFPFG